MTHAGRTKKVAQPTPRRRVIPWIRLIALAALSLWGSVRQSDTITAATTPSAYVCFPTCENDGRLLATSGKDSASISDRTTMFGLVAPPDGLGEATISFNIFDGDNGTTWWD